MLPAKSPVLHRREKSLGRGLGAGKSTEVNEAGGSIVQEQEKEKTTGGKRQVEQGKSPFVFQRQADSIRDPRGGEVRPVERLQRIQIQDRRGETVRIHELFGADHPKDQNQQERQQDAQNDKERADFSRRQQGRAAKNNQAAYARGNYTQAKDSPGSRQVKTGSRFENHAVGQKDGKAEGHHHPRGVKGAAKPAGQKNMPDRNGQGMHQRKIAAQIQVRQAVDDAAE